MGRKVWAGCPGVLSAIAGVVVLVWPKMDLFGPETTLKARYDSSATIREVDSALSADHGTSRPPDTASRGFLLAGWLMGASEDDGNAHPRLAGESRSGRDQRWCSVRRRERGLASVLRESGIHQQP